MDTLDSKLLRLLVKDAHQTSDALAEQLNVSSATIRRRLSKLMREGILHIVARVDPKKLGFTIIAVLAFDVELDKLTSAVLALSERPEIKWLATTTGRFDIIALTCFRDQDELLDFLQGKGSKIEGLKNIETAICFNAPMWW